MEDEVDVAVAEPTPIENLINTVANQDFSKAAPTFAEIMQGKIDAALEQEKIAVARDVFGNQIPDTEDDDEIVNDDVSEQEPEDDDITDEEIDAAIDETDDEE